MDGALSVNGLEASRFEPIAGLRVHNAIVPSGLELELTNSIDAAPWITDLKRRVQHYGYRYDYRARKIKPDAYLGPLPKWSQKLAALMVAKGWFATPPDQLIVNEYLPGQGIAPHVDCEPCFGDTIVSISLLSSCEMQFRHRITGERHAIILEPSSALILSGEARYDWTHGIPARKSDSVGGVRTPRDRRLSLTFRTVEFD